MISIKKEAKLNLPAGIDSPDEFDCIDGHRPKSNFIISRDQNNQIASTYGDIRWDVSTWHPEGRLVVLNFDFWPKSELTSYRQKLSSDARWLMFSLIWVSEERPLAVASLKGMLMIIRALAFAAEKSGCSILDILSDEERLVAFLREPGLKRSTCVKGLSSLISRLIRIDDRQLGFSIVNNNFRKKILAENTEIRRRQRQTPPMPTVIYSAVLSRLMSELDDWEEVASECLRLLQDCGKDPRYGRNERVQRIWSGRMGFKCLKRLPQWEDVASPRVRQYLRAKGAADNVVGLGNVVVEVQAATKLVIQAFTGMRDNEAITLPFDCLLTNSIGGRSHRLVQGYTTKLSKSLKVVRWVTNNEGQRAVEIAQKIAVAIYAACGKTSEAPAHSRRPMNRRPLFPSTAYTYVCTNKRRFTLEDHFFPVDLGLYKFDRLLSRVLPLIRNEDIEELESIDEHRAWRSEAKFNMGAPWPLTTHQFRRSLALYAQRSGLVTLPSLRRQLQHITEEMSRYYANGSQYAKDLMVDGPLDSEHFSFDWQNTKVESESASYIANVLLSDEKLFGGHAAFVSQRLKATHQVLSARTRNETVRMFRKGQLHYRETLIGGCTRKDECSRPALDWMNIECISKNCGNMVGSLMKLELVVKEQARLVKSLPPASLLYRTEKTNLDILVGALERVRQENKAAT